MKQIEYIVRLIIDYILKSGEPKTTDNLKRVYQKNPSVRKLVEQLEKDNNWEKYLKNYITFSGQHQKQKKLALKRFMREIAVQPAGRRSYLRSISIAAACCLFFLCGSIVYMKLRPKQAESVEMAITTAKSIQPGTHKATIILDDGRQVPLESVAAGVVIANGIQDLNGKPLISDVRQVHYMTLEIPKGGEYTVTLPDKTKVYLNAASKLHYPLKFDSENRVVELEGEAFFEVEHNPYSPFIVKTRLGDIEVLGTKFNVKSYDDETESYVTLASGSVKIKDHVSQEILLKPGYQSVSSLHGNTYSHKVNVEDFIGWKSGQFVFVDEELPVAMQKIARWYDLDIVTHPSATGLKIWGTLNRYETFDKVLEILKIIDKDLKVTIRGRRVDIMK